MYIELEDGELVRNGDTVNVKDFGYGTVVYIGEDNTIDVKHSDKISRGQIREYHISEISLKMTIGRKHDDNVVEEYKGYDIVKSGEDCYEVVDDESRFIVGLDDSKSCGHRTSVPVTVKDAKDYIDWVTK